MLQPEQKSKIGDDGELQVPVIVPEKAKKRPSLYRRFSLRFLLFANLFTALLCIGIVLLIVSAAVINNRVVHPSMLTAQQESVISNAQVEVIVALTQTAKAYTPVSTLEPWAIPSTKTAVFLALMDRLGTPAKQEYTRQGEFDSFEQAVGENEVIVGSGRGFLGMEHNSNGDCAVFLIRGAAQANFSVNAGRWALWQNITAQDDIDFLIEQERIIVDAQEDCATIDVISVPTQS
jgi:hypothetical protein